MRLILPSIFSLLFYGIAVAAPQDPPPNANEGSNAGSILGTPSAADNTTLAETRLTWGPIIIFRPTPIATITSRMLFNQDGSFLYDTRVIAGGSGCYNYGVICGMRDTAGNGWLVSRGSTSFGVKIGNGCPPISHKITAGRTDARLAQFWDNILAGDRWFWCRGEVAESEIDWVPLVTKVKSDIEIGSGPVSRYIGLI
ncbi:hypothetical protein OQA88_5294 [Cercophora sp. LCS_1]